MRPDALIAQRFDKLVADGSIIAVQFSAEAYASWIVSSMLLVERVFGPESPHRKHLEAFNASLRRSGASSYFLNSLCGILAAARDDYTGGHLTRTRSLLRAEVGEDILEQAEELLKAGFKDPSCILAGVALENALRDLCERAVVQEGKLDRMNADLAGKEIYNKGMQKQITAWAHWRNKAAHGEWNEYTQDDVRAMIDGVRRFTSEYV